MSEATIPVDFAPSDEATDIVEIQHENLSNRIKQLEHVLKMEKKLRRSQVEMMHRELQKATETVRNLSVSATQQKQRISELSVERTNMREYINNLNKQRNKYRGIAQQYQAAINKMKKAA